MPELYTYKTKKSREISVKYITEYNYVDYIYEANFIKNLETKYSYQVDAFNNTVQLDLYFNQPIIDIVFCLERNSRVLSCEGRGDKNLHFIRYKDILEILNDEPIIYIRLIYQIYTEDKNKSNFFINKNSGILAEYIFGNDYSKIEIKCNKDVLLNQKLHNSSYYYTTPSELALIGFEKSKLWITVYNGVINIHKNDYGHLTNVIKSYIDLFDKFYYEMFDEHIHVDILDTGAINSMAISLEGIVLLHSKIAENLTLMLNRYLLHEILHQKIGLEIKFTGLGMEWLKESLVEYMQYICLEKRYSTQLSIKLLEYYKLLYIKNNKNEIPIQQTYTGMPIEQYNAVVCGKGFFVMRALITRSNAIEEKTVIKSLLQKMVINKRIDLPKFKNICINIFDKDIENFLHSWLSNTGIPIYEIRWKQTNDIIQVKIKQIGEIYYNMIELMLHMKNGSCKFKTYNLDKRQKDIFIRSKDEVISIVFEPKMKILSDIIYK